MFIDLFKGQLGFVPSSLEIFIVTSKLTESITLILLGRESIYLAAAVIEDKQLTIMAFSERGNIQLAVQQLCHAVFTLLILLQRPDYAAAIIENR